MAFKQTSFEFKDLIKALDKYETAYLKDKKLSLRELSENTNISNSSTMGRILNEISLEPLYGSRNSKNKGYKN